MGTANSTIARSMEMAVKSCLEPRMASLISANHRVALEGMGLLPAVLNVITSMPTKIGGKQHAWTTLAGRDADR
jgi:hypothetical protein